MTRWSSTAMSSSRPAATASAVRCRSSGLGVGSPGRVVVDEDEPRRMEADGITEELRDAHERGRDVAAVDGAAWRARRCACRGARRAAPRAGGGPSSATSREARSAGPRMVQPSRPASPTTARRPSSKAALSRAARAGPDARHTRELLRGWRPPARPGRRSGPARPGRCCRRRGLPVPVAQRRPMSSAAERPLRHAAPAAHGGRSAGGSSRTARAPQVRRDARQCAPSLCLGWRLRVRTTEPANSPAVRSRRRRAA